MVALAVGLVVGAEAALGERVLELVCETLGLPRGTVVIDSDLTRDLGADSLDITELLMLLEERFGCLLSGDEIRGLRTVGDIVCFLEGKLS